MSSRPAWSTRASSRTGTKATEKPCLDGKKDPFFIFSASTEIYTSLHTAIEHFSLRLSYFYYIKVSGQIWITLSRSHSISWVNNKKQSHTNHAVSLRLEMSHWPVIEKHLAMNVGLSGQDSQTENDIKIQDLNNKQLLGWTFRLGIHAESPLLQKDYVYQSCFMPDLESVINPWEFVLVYASPRATSLLWICSEI